MGQTSSQCNEACHISRNTTGRPEHHSPDTTTLCQVQWRTRPDPRLKERASEQVQPCNEYAVTADAPNSDITCCSFTTPPCQCHHGVACNPWHETGIASVSCSWSDHRAKALTGGRGLGSTKVSCSWSDHRANTLTGGRGLGSKQTGWDEVP